MLYICIANLKQIVDMRITIELNSDNSRRTFGGKSYKLGSELRDILESVNDWDVNAVNIDGVPISEDDEASIREMERQFDLVIWGKTDSEYFNRKDRATAEDYLDMRIDDNINERL